MNTLGIFGSSGLAREIAEIAFEIGYEKIYLIDTYNSIESINRLEIISEDELLKQDYQIEDFIIGIGEGRIRKKIYLKFPSLNYINLIHPLVNFRYKKKFEDVSFKGNVFYAGVSLTNNIEVGDFCIFSPNVTIGHDCIIENFITVLPGANISGNVLLKSGCYIGAGSVVLQGKSLEDKLVVGENSVVGAGAVVVKNVESNKIVKGIPAK